MLFFNSQIFTMLQLNFHPFPELKTERLFLRRLKKEDASCVFRLRSDERVMKYIGKFPQRSLDEALEFINMIDDSLTTNNGITWAIALKENPEILIGTIGHWRVMKEHYRSEVGYMIHADYWRKGIGKEALIKVIDYGFKTMHLHSIEAHINPENTASARVLESTGFMRDGFFKESFYFNGAFGDTAIYSLLAGKE